MKSNISGSTINLVMYEANTFTLRNQLQLRLGPYLAKMRKLWEDSLKQAFEHMPNTIGNIIRNYRQTSPLTDVKAVELLHGIVPTAYPYREDS